MKEHSEKFRKMIGEYSRMEMHELAEILGVKMERFNSLPLESLVEQVSPTLKPVVLASMEIYERFRRYPVSVTLKKFEDVVNVLKPLMSEEDGTECIVISMNPHNVVRSIDHACFGMSFNEDMIRSICQTAVEKNAYSVIVAHNTPEYNSLPDSKDIEVVKKLRKALDIIGIKFIDHVKIAKGGECYSFAEESITRE